MSILAGFLKGVGQAGAEAEMARHESELAEQRMRTQNELSKAREVSLLDLKRRYANEQLEAQAAQIRDLANSSDTIKSRILGAYGEDAMDNLESLVILPDFMKNLSALTPEQEAARTAAGLSAEVEAGVPAIRRAIEVDDIAAEAVAKSNAEAITAEQDGRSSAVTALSRWNNGGAQLARLQAEAEAYGQAAGSRAEAIEGIRESTQASLIGSRGMEGVEKLREVGLIRPDDINTGQQFGYLNLHLEDLPDNPVSLLSMTTGPVDSLRETLSANAVTASLARPLIENAENFAEARKAKQAVEQRISRVQMISSQLSQDLADSTALAKIGGFMTGDDSAVESAEALLDEMADVISIENRKLTDPSFTDRLRSDSLRRKENAIAAVGMLEELLATHRMATTEVPWTTVDGTRGFAPVAIFNEDQLMTLIDNMKQDTTGRIYNNKMREVALMRLNQIRLSRQFPTDRNAFGGSSRVR